MPITVSRRRPSTPTALESDATEEASSAPMKNITMTPMMPPLKSAPRINASSTIRTVWTMITTAS